MGAEPADPGAPPGLVLGLAAANCGSSPACSIPGAGHGMELSRAGSQLCVPGQGVVTLLLPGILEEALDRGFVFEGVPGVCWALSEAEEGVLSELLVFIFIFYVFIFIFHIVVSLQGGHHGGSWVVLAV